MRTIEDIEVDWNEPLWRYVKLDRFLEVVRTSRFYFAAEMQFADPFEGAVAVQTNLPPSDLRIPTKSAGDSGLMSATHSD
jgi:hypothetical protein